MTDIPDPAAVEPPLAHRDQLNDLLWETTTYIELMGEAALAGTPLTLPSSGMLTAVLVEPGITIADMSRRMPKSQQAISQVAARLEKLGMLERRGGAGRGGRLFGTHAGRATSGGGGRAEASVCSSPTRAARWPRSAWRASASSSRGCASCSATSATRSSP